MTNIIDINYRRSSNPRLPKEQLDATFHRSELTAKKSGEKGLRNLRDSNPVPPKDRYTIAAALGRELERAKKIPGFRTTDLPMAKQKAFATPIAFQKILNRLHIPESRSLQPNRTIPRRLDANGSRYADLIESIAEVTGQNVVILADRVLRGTGFSLSDPSYLPMRLVGAMSDAVQWYNRKFGWLQTFNDTANAHRYLLDQGIMIGFPSDYSYPDRETEAAAGHTLSQTLGLPPSQIYRESALETAAALTFSDSRVADLVKFAQHLRSPGCRNLWGVHTEAPERWQSWADLPDSYVDFGYESWDSFQFLPRLFVGIEAPWRNESPWRDQVPQFDKQLITWTNDVWKGTNPASYLDGIGYFHLVPMPSFRGDEIIPVVASCMTAEWGAPCLPLIPEMAPRLEKVFVCAPSDGEHPTEIVTLLEALIRAQVRLDKEWRETAHAMCGNPILRAAAQRQKDLDRLQQPPLDDEVPRQ